MNHSLTLTPNQFNTLYREIKKQVTWTTLRAIVFAVADNLPKDLTVTNLDQRMKFIQSRGCNFSDTQIINRLISKLVKDKILSVNEINRLLEDVLGQPVHKIGRIQVNESSAWVISWQSGIEDDEEYSLTKYDIEISEVVPETIVELIQSAFILINSKSYVSAMSLALVALEATLWDHLKTKNINKIVNIEEYPHPVFAKITWDGKSYQVELKDHLGNNKVPSSPASTEFVVYRTGQYDNKTKKRKLTLEIDDEFSDLLSTADDMVVKTKEKDTISVALERARKENLIPEHLWTSELDKLLVDLRNKMVHQSAEIEDKKFDSPFGEIKMVEFYNTPTLVMYFIRTIISYIEHAYYEIGLSKLI